jgi:hypothetical protein
LPPEFQREVAAQARKMDCGGADWVWRAIEELDLMPKS